jgi:hypothetical protein
LGNGIEVQSFVANESKSDKSAGLPALFFEIYKTTERRSCKKKTYAICRKTNFPLLQVKHDLFTNVIFKTLIPLNVVFLE